MASFVKRTNTTRRYEYIMKAPAHASELDKALAVAQRDVNDYAARQPKGEVAPEIWITQDGENIIVYWEHETAPFRELNQSERR